MADQPPQDQTTNKSTTNASGLPPLDLSAAWPAPLLTIPLSPHVDSTAPTTLTIRPYHATDAPHLASQANNSKIAVNMTNRFPHPYTLADAQSFIQKSLNSKQSGVYAWTVSLTPTGPPIGGCGFDIGSDVFARGVEIGYWLGEEYWGRGYGTAVCEALTGWAFGLEKGVTGEGEKLERVGAGVFSGNGGSGRVLEKAGYTKEGVMRGCVWKWGERRDMEMWSVLREEWEAAGEEGIMSRLRSNGV